MTNSPLLCAEYISMSFFSNDDFINLSQYSLPLSTHILFGLRFDSFQIFWKELVIVIAFLSFKGIAHAYLLKISITPNKNLNTLLNLLINCVSARSAPKYCL